MGMITHPAFPEWETDSPVGKGAGELRVRLRGVVVGHALVDHHGVLLSSCSFGTDSRFASILHTFVEVCSLTWRDAFLEQQVCETRRWQEDQRVFGPAADAVFAQHYGSGTNNAETDVANARVEVPGRTFPWAP